MTYHSVCRRGENAITERELLAELLGSISGSLCQFVESTDPTKLNWKPEVAGSADTRSVLDLVGECVAVNRAFAELLTADGLSNSFNRSGNAPVDASDARDQLSSSVEKLIGTTNSITDQDLDKLYNHWRGPASGRALIIGAYRNMAYHAGQINLIQILGGDGEFHLPTNWY